MNQIESALETLRNAIREELLAEIVNNIGNARPANRVGNGAASQRVRQRREAMPPEMIVGVLIEHDAGLKAEELRTALKLDKPDFLKSIRLALVSGMVVKEGDKRSTIYKAADRKNAPVIDNPAEVLAGAAATEPAPSERIIRRRKR